MEANPVEVTAPPARTDGRSRLTLVLLTALIVASALLRLWYLPAPGRFNGETAAIENIQAVFAGSEDRDHRVSSLAWYPQLLMLRLADRLYQSTGHEPLHVVTAKDRVTRPGVHLARHLSVLYGMAGVFFLYLIARRLHTAAVALLAAVILCFSPWHIQASVAFAPDILVLCLSVLALWLGLRALDRPLPARFALVGLALGAAAAAKVTGGLIAVPVLLGLVFGGHRQLRRMLLPMVITAPVALATWWALTPPNGPYLAALDLEQAVQAKRAAREMSSRFTVAVFGLLHPLRETVHGRLLGALSILGAVGQVFRCLFLVDPGPARAHRLMVLAAAPVFALGYAWTTPLFRESSFVPLLAYSSLYAAVMLGILWDGLVALSPRLRAPWTVAAATVLVLALVVPPGWRYVHSRAVQSTVSAALDWLRQELGEGGPRIVVVEEAGLSGAAASAMQLARGLAVSVVPRLAELDGERLARADAEVFLRRELSGGHQEFYRGRQQHAERRRVFEGRLLRRRGPDLVVVVHPYGTGPAEEVELAVQPDGKRRRVILPASAEDVASVALVLRLPPTHETAPVAPRAWLDGVEIDLAPGGFFPRNALFVSERLPPAATPRGLRIAPPTWMAVRRGEITVASYSWRSRHPRPIAP